MGLALFYMEIYITQNVMQISHKKGTEKCNRALKFNFFLLGDV